MGSNESCTHAMRLNWLSAIEMEEVCLAGRLNTHRTMVASRKKPRIKWLIQNTEWKNMKVLFFCCCCCCCFLFANWRKETNAFGEIVLNYCSTAFQVYQNNSQSILEQPCQNCLMWFGILNLMNILTKSTLLMKVKIRTITFSCWFFFLNLLLMSIW